MRRRYSKEIIESAVKQSESWSGVCRLLNIKPATGSQTYIKNKAVKLGIDSTHFTGRGYRRNKVYPPKRTALEYCFYGSTENSHRIKERLIREGIKKSICEFCGIADWYGEELPLELDHINGDHIDNRIENLKILCPNCHSVKTRKQRKLKVV